MIRWLELVKEKDPQALTRAIYFARDFLEIETFKAMRQYWDEALVRKFLRSRNSRIHYYTLTYMANTVPDLLRIFIDSHRNCPHIYVWPVMRSKDEQIKRHVIKTANLNHPMPQRGICYMFVLMEGTADDILYMYYMDKVPKWSIIYEGAKLCAPYVFKKVVEALDTVDVLDKYERTPLEALLFKSTINTFNLRILLQKSSLQRARLHEMLIVRGHEHLAFLMRHLIAERA